jgi:hypothetical protein
MKFGIRKPNLKSRITSRISWKRAVRHRLGLKAPRGYGWLTNPKKALYNRIYNRTSIGCVTLPAILIVAAIPAIATASLTLWLLEII